MATGQRTQVPLRSERLNAVCPYYTMFPLSFPSEVIREHGPARVLDPFCGRGTTLFASRLLGVPATGIDLNPVAVALARAKLARATPAVVARLANRLIDSTEADAPEGEFWSWCYHPDTLSQLVRLRAGLLTAGDGAAATLLRAVALGILHGPIMRKAPTYLSNQMPRTYASKPAYSVRYWASRDLLPPRVDVKEAITRRVAYSLCEMPPTVPGGRVYEGSAADVLSGLRQQFDLIVTSPPYFGMRTYLPDQWLRAWFLGGPDRVEYATGSALESEREEVFLQGLADVWRVAARRCGVGAKLIVRFGALPSKTRDPAALITTSLRMSAAGWLIRDVRPLVAPPRQRRQAEHFIRHKDLDAVVQEVDVTAERVV